MGHRRSIFVGASEERLEKLIRDRLKQDANKKNINHGLHRLTRIKTKIIIIFKYQKNRLKNRYCCV